MPPCCARPVARLVGPRASWLPRAFFALLAAPLSSSVAAQEPERTAPPLVAFEAFAGGEFDAYLRTLQNLGRIAPYPWSIRGFSPREVRAFALADSLHPWGRRYPIAAEPERAELGTVRPRARVLYNTGFPFGGDDGPVWSGRGLTGALSAGVYARVGAFSVVLAPTVFRAQNRAFELADVGSAANPFADPRSPGGIDLPQRFGTGSYGRVDPGNSSARLDLPWVTLGLSSAAQQWGPSQLHPLLLGRNAGGFPHVFLGTPGPGDLWIGELHARYVAGRLEQSAWGPAVVDPRRLVTGIVATFTPRGLPGLELGGARFYHVNWPEGGVGLGDLARPFEAIFKNAIPDADTRAPDNQLASAFARWNLPAAGLAVFGEFVREDASVDLRVLTLEPDDLSGYSLGLRRVTEGADSTGRRLRVARLEVLITGSSHRSRGSARRGIEFRAFHLYQHGGVNQGHTLRGQLLASAAARGGAALTAGFDVYHPGGRWSVQLDRAVERDATTGVVDDPSGDTDVTYALGGEMLRFVGSWELSAAAAAVYELNRHFRGDAFNLNVRLGAAFVPR